MQSLASQIQALAGSANNTEMSDWANEGAIEIINILPPILKEKCMADTNLYIGNTDTTMDMDGVLEIINVVRENANVGYYTDCRRVPIAYSGSLYDSSSIHYASSTDPAYFIYSSSSASTLKVLPLPTAAQPAIVYHISYPSIDVSAVSTIANFPDEAEYLVVLYAAIKVLHNKMNEKNADLPTDISTITLPVTPTPPSTPSFSAISLSTVTVDATTISNVGVPPSYTSPTVGGASEELTASITALTSDTTGTDADFLDFSKWFAAVGEYIEDEEDTELATAQLQKYKLIYKHILKQ